METEFLTDEEMTTLTGINRKSRQVEWLRENGWRFVKTLSGKPIVSRIYCRQKLSDSVPEAYSVGADMPDFSQVA